MTKPTPRNREFWLTARIGKQNDARIKLTDQEREDIKQLHKDGVAIREIARQFEGKCSRSLIQFTIFPERKAKAAKRLKDNKVWQNYSDTKTRREAQAKHRAKIKQLHEAKKI